MTQTGEVLAGRVALVTGAARGLGYYFVEALIAAGAKVAMVARSADALQEAAVRFGASALPVPTDVTAPDAVRAAFTQTKAAFGGLDILVNNATINHLHRVEDATDAELQAEVGVNVLGAIYCMREAIPLMRARGGGDIVNISSETVMRPFPFLTMYAATKAAIENLTRGLREEVRHENIRLTTLQSGPVNSGGAFLQGSNPELMRRFGEAATKGGYMHDVGPPIDPQTTAQALIDVLKLPREAHIDFVAVRSR